MFGSFMQTEAELGKVWIHEKGNKDLKKADGMKYMVGDCERCPQEQRVSKRCREYMEKGKARFAV
jgi:hypothetical protein